MTLHSPLSGPVNSGFGGGKRYKSKIVFGIAVMGFIPFVMSTFAASVTVGNGALEFGQGSQQAIACDSKIYIAMGEEWHGAPTTNDPSAGFFRVRAVTVSNLDLQNCAGKKLRVRLIDGTSQEIGIGPVPEAKVMQVTLPTTPPVSNISDSTALLLTYLTGTGTPISGTLLASSAVSISGTSIYDGSVLSANNADVTFFIDPAKTAVNIDGQSVFRTTVETIDNPAAAAPTQ
jgi:hypothetical protein